MKKTLLTLALVGLSAAATYAQGTVQFLNSTLSKVKYQADSASAVVDAPTGTKIGLFWGNSADSLQLAGTTTIGATAGIFNAGAVYAINGTTENTRVFLKIAGWDASAGDNWAASQHYGESSVVNALLGPTAGPGTVIWQSASGTSTERMKPFTIVLVPEPSVIALGALGLGALLLRRRKA